MVRKMSEQTNNAQPTAFHHMLATLAHEGRLLRLYTQNVDGLETTLPPLVTRVPLAREDRAWPKTVQLHGSLAKMVCAKCHAVSDFESELFEGPVPPLCKACEAQDIVRTEHAGKRSHGVGILRPRMVLYSEHNPDADAIGLVTSADLRARPDAVIVVGTTLKVPGVKRIVQEMCGTVRDRRDGLTVWINTEDAPPIGKALEWDLIVKGPCDEVARHAALRQWDDVVHEVTDEEMRKAREASEAQVIVVSPAKPRTFEQVHGVPTPVASPKFLAKTTKLASIVEKNPSTLSSASTGKNAGKKTVGKATATTAPKAAAPKRKRQQAKKAEKPNAKIGFKITKASAPTAISKPDDKVQGKLPPQQIKLEQPIPQKPFPLQTQPIEFVEWKQENPGPMKVKSFETPRKPPPLPFSAPMAPLSPSDVRNNASPASPVAPGYSPYTPYRSKSLEVKHAPLEPLSLTQRRASEGTKASSGTISPTGYIPDNIRLLLD